ncbi:hypothetical protein BJ912DRAFT_608013 [Pholiota molesta]|nr:hypothetical protein BJ912DRAFT_608013 [Pholiota molesta]
MQAPPQKPAPTAVTVSSSPSVTSIRPATIQTPTVTASSSPSVRPTTTQIHTARPSLSASNGNAELAPTPSAKALGKRKAVSPSPPMTGTSVYHPNYPSANQPEGPSNYPHPYNQSLPAQSSLFASSSSTTVTYLQPPAIVEYYPNLILARLPSAHTSTRPNLSHTSLQTDLASTPVVNLHLGRRRRRRSSFKSIPTRRSTRRGLMGSRPRPPIKSQSQTWGCLMMISLIFLHLLPNKRQILNQRPILTVTCFRFRILPPG